MKFFKFVILLILAFNVYAENIHKKEADSNCRKGSFLLPCLNLNKAVRAGDVKKVEKLLRSGENPNQQSYGGPAPLHLAAEKGNIQIITLLLNAKAQVNITTNGGKTTPLTLAVINSHNEVVKLLLKNGALPLNPVKAEAMHALHRLNDDTFKLMVKTYCNKFPDKFPNYCK